jgi:hypothetical protein
VQKTNTPKKLFRVTGYADGVGWIDEYVNAASRAQAVKLIDIRLRKRYPRLNLYLGDCKVEEVLERAQSRPEHKTQEIQNEQGRLI